MTDCIRVAIFKNPLLRPKKLFTDEQNRVRDSLGNNKIEYSI